ncbi:MAG: hypothetical protein P9M15_04425, partial [Candidatus Electryoneaceae bacterium]|nr:hypothetical protein [Candidatus Electryoneaceae bacterium]
MFTTAVFRHTRGYDGTLLLSALLVVTILIGCAPKQIEMESGIPQHEELIRDLMLGDDITASNTVD